MSESRSMLTMRDTRASLLLTHSFFGCLSLHLDMVEDSSIETASVNTKRMRFNPTYVESLTMSKRKGLIAHECMHPALLHPQRLAAMLAAGFTHAESNEAADYAINPLLIASGLELPDGALLDPEYENMSMEQIARARRAKKESETPKPDPQGDDSQGDDSQGDDSQGDGTSEQEPQGAGNNATGSFEMAGEQDSAESEQETQQWQEHVASAIRAASSAGKLPAHIKIAMESTLAPQAACWDTLRRFISDRSETRNSWTKQSRRTSVSNVIMPGKQANGVGCIVIMIDTSGSVVQALPTFGANVAAIMEDVSPSQIHVIYSDAEVNHVDVFERGDVLHFEPHGGGGTDFRPAFEYVEREQLEPVCAIYLTDLCGDFPEREPSYPVIWASYAAPRGTQAPFGETIAID